MKKTMLALLAVAIATTSIVSVSSAGSSIGGGLHYLRNIGDIDKNTELSKDSFSILGSYMYSMPMIKIEGQVEYVFDYANSDNSMWIPQAYVLVGGMIYGGAGIGIGRIDGEWTSDPFYTLRAGVNLPLAALNLDVYGTYMFWTDDDLKAATGEDLDSVTLAAVLRFSL